jgi:hypothetical protein
MGRGSVVRVLRMFHLLLCAHKGCRKLELPDLLLLNAVLAGVCVVLRLCGEESTKKRVTVACPRCEEAVAHDRVYQHLDDNHTLGFIAV